MMMTEGWMMMIEGWMMMIEGWMMVELVIEGWMEALGVGGRRVGGTVRGQVFFLNGRPGQHARGS